MTARMVCPKCGSDDVECAPKPTHMHLCNACGYDGRCRLCGGTGRITVGPSPTVNYGFAYSTPCECPNAATPKDDE